MAEEEGNKESEKLEEHLKNVRAFWDVFDGVKSRGGKHGEAKALAALEAALNLYYTNAGVKIVFG